MMDHPNIISYYDSFEEDGTVVIEMEYADGGYVVIPNFLFKIKFLLSSSYFYQPVPIYDTVNTISSYTLALIFLEVL